MKWPSPGDPANSPSWDNYIVAQTAQACLGLIPAHAVAIGVIPRAREVELVFQLTEIDDADREDVRDIVDELEMLTGPDVTVATQLEVVDLPQLARAPHARWIYKRRGRVQSKAGD